MGQDRSPSLSAHPWFSRTRVRWPAARAAGRPSPRPASRPPTVGPVPAADGDLPFSLFLFFLSSSSSSSSSSSFSSSPSSRSSHVGGGMATAEGAAPLSIRLPLSHTLSPPSVSLFEISLPLSLFLSLFFSDLPLPALTLSSPSLCPLSHPLPLPLPHTLSLFYTSDLTLMVRGLTGERGAAATTARGRRRRRQRGDGGGGEDGLRQRPREEEGKVTAEDDGGARGGRGRREGGSGEVTSRHSPLPLF